MGGSVMHQLAIALKQKGYQVSGSDDEIYEPARNNLEKAGLLPLSDGWDANRITPDLDAVILGMHAREGNPEIDKARALNIPLYSFPEYIYKESLDKKRVVIGGSHGKTTITSMILHVLQHIGKDFDYLVGARIPGFDYSVRISEAPLIVCEGDEYPASAIQKKPKFFFYHPDIAVISGIAWDHINVFPTFDIYLQQFSLFIQNMQPGSILIFNEEDKHLVKLTGEHGQHLKLIPYSTPQYRVQEEITFINYGETEIPLQVFGTHNLQNIAAARLVCAQLNITDKDFYTSIRSFRGASRRLEKIFEKPDAALYRDFAHAPSKVRASIHAMKEQYPDRKLAAVLELHTYSSLNAEFLVQYQDAMEEADTACVYYSNHALEIKKLSPLSPKPVQQAFGREDLAVLNQPDALRAWISGQPSENTNLLMMSSGSFDGIKPEEMIKLWQKN